MSVDSLMKCLSPHDPEADLHGRIVSGADLGLRNRGRLVLVDGVVRQLEALAGLASNVPLVDVDGVDGPSVDSANRSGRKLKPNNK